MNVTNISGVLRGKLPGSLVCKQKSSNKQFFVLDPITLISLLMLQTQSRISITEWGVGRGGGERHFAA